MTRRPVRPVTPESVINDVVLDSLHGDASGFDAARVVEALREAGFLRAGLFCGCAWVTKYCEENH